jgi:segregation and condensation protein A
MLDENKILDFIKSEYSWEQIIYEIIAWEGLDPWDLDLSKISNGFLRYLGAMKELDFRVPAKYVMVASILLRMKSDYLRQFKEQVTGETEQSMQEALQQIESPEAPFEINPLAMPPRREPVRGVVVSELVKALRKVLKAHERREFRTEKLRKDIDITGDNINERIKTLYMKISSLLSKVKKDEVQFSKIVGEWKREEVVTNFIPLVHLEQQKKVRSRQEELFEEIWVSRRDKE